MMKGTDNTGMRSDAHAFAFYGGEQLNKMGAVWFVSYAYHEHIDATHLTWRRVSTARTRAKRFSNTFSYHRYWLDKIMSMDSRRLEKNEIGLTALEVKRMAEAVMEKVW